MTRDVRLWIYDRLASLLAGLADGIELVTSSPVRRLERRVYRAWLGRWRLSADRWDSSVQTASVDEWRAAVRDDSRETI